MFKVLLVEDSVLYRSILKHVLLKRFVDLEIKESSGDKDTLNTIDTFYPDLIIMDIELNNELTGLDLTKIIKIKHPGIVVVIFSQNDTPEYREVAQKNGANFFLPKSTSLENIFDCVGSIVVN